MERFKLQARLKTPIVLRGYTTLDALLMSVLSKGDVSNLLKCVDGLYFASAALPEELGLQQKASFVASMRPDHTPEWSNLIRPNARTKNGWAEGNDLKIGLSRQREGGNILNTYIAKYAPVVEWHAVGDGEAVLSLLKETQFLGKRRTCGYGEVAKWSLHQGELDGIVGYAHEPMRPIPVERWEHGGDWVPQEAAWKAPYWELANRTKCYVPIAV